MNKANKEIRCPLCNAELEQGEYLENEEGKFESQMICMEPECNYVGKGSVK